MNSSNRRRNRVVGNNTPALSTEEIEHVLGTASPVRQINPSLSSRRSQRHSPYPTSTRDNNNTNMRNIESLTHINIPDMRNSEQNITSNMRSIESPTHMIENQHVRFNRVTYRLLTYVSVTLAPL
ncbi:13317_t:CDS:2 [Ambispora gerdemannii]|uniref:13317_t:CDS:1 n=1 Tax=Ambispora gerdemannii TaxID=144530 RepID=A0A9N9GET4_9GLOM|nr:13317_t:CDS:2 [Ambispora gerdemannii]